MRAANDNALALTAHADHVDRAWVTTAAELQRWLNLLSREVDLEATVLITGKPFQHVRSASLTRLTLTDGSVVHDIFLG